MTSREGESGGMIVCKNIAERPRLRCTTVSGSFESDAPKAWHHADCGPSRPQADVAVRRVWAVACMIGHSRGRAPAIPVGAGAGVIAGGSIKIDTGTASACEDGVEPTETDWIVRTRVSKQSAGTGSLRFMIGLKMAVMECLAAVLAVF